LKVEVTVTLAHIKAGVRYSSTRCPIARAIKHACPKAELHGCHVYFDGRFISLPTRARRFIGRFDGELPVKPFSFTIPNLG